MKTNEVQVEVTSNYIAEQSKPENSQYVYAYTIQITNNGASSAQLISRHWTITDENDRTQEVQGMGVVGEQPIIKPGESYTYSSGVVMETKTGMMNGSYTMRDAAGVEFKADIPAFALVLPNALH